MVAGGQGEEAGGGPEGQDALGQRAQRGRVRQALNPQPSTLNPQPSTLNPQPSTLNPQPSTLKPSNPQPATRNPQPAILNPQPSTLSYGRAACRRAFTLNERRHHCRVCGRVFCDACSPKDLNLTYFLTDPDASGEGGETVEEELAEGEELPLQRGCAGCKRDLERMRLTANTRRLVDGSSSHVLRNLYHPVSGYVAAIRGSMSSLERSVGYLERMCELAGPQVIVNNNLTILWGGFKNLLIILFKTD